MIKINRHFKINKSMIMYKRINTYKYDSSLLNGTLHTATLFLITESVSNELCTKWRVRGTQCVFMMTAFSASALNHQVIIVQRWAFIGSEICEFISLPSVRDARFSAAAQKYELIVLLDFWQMLNWRSLRVQTEQTETHHRKQAEHILDVAQSKSHLDGLFTQSSSAVYCPFKAQNELRHHVSTSI